MCCLVFVPSVCFPLVCFGWAGVSGFVVVFCLFVCFVVVVVSLFCFVCFGVFLMLRFFSFFVFLLCMCQCVLFFVMLFWFVCF